MICSSLEEKTFFGQRIKASCETILPLRIAWPKFFLDFEMGINFIKVIGWKKRLPALIYVLSISKVKILI